MSDKPIPLLETQIKRVDEHVQRLCDVQQNNLKGTAFEDFFPFLKRSWDFVFRDFFSSSNGVVSTPIFQVVVDRGVLAIQTALVSMQFSKAMHPRYLDKIERPIFNCVIWETHQGDGSLQTKEIPYSDAPGADGLSAEQMINIMKDIIPNMDGRNTLEYPMHLMALVLQIITFNMVRRMSYLGTERGLTHPRVEGEVIKASFSNGLLVHDIYIGESVAWKDWDDMMTRYKETYEGDDEQ